jgi:hypothetical protein
VEGKHRIAHLHQLRNHADRQPLPDLSLYVIAHLSFIHATELISTSLGRTILACIALFWILRLILQSFVFGARHQVSMLYIVIFAIGAPLNLILFLWILS